MKSLCRNAGKFQWNAKLSCLKPGQERKVERVTVFCDDRDDAVLEASAVARAMGYWHVTVDHITKVGGN